MCRCIGRLVRLTESGIEWEEQKPARWTCSHVDSRRESTWSPLRGPLTSVPGQDDRRLRSWGT